MKRLEEQAKDLLSGYPSLGKLNSEINKMISEKYGIQGEGGKEKFQNFLSGKIYFSLYNTPSKLNEKILFINRYPNFLYLSEEKVGGEIICKVLDLTVIPPDFKSQILNRIFNVYYDKIKSNDEKIGFTQESLNIKGLDLEKIVGDLGYKNAVFGFKKQYLTNTKVVDYSDWVKLVYFNQSSMEGLSLEQIYNRYKSKTKT
jgi:hypothetical protein